MTINKTGSIRKTGNEWWKNPEKKTDISRKISEKISGKIRANIRDGKKQCRKCLEWISTDSFGIFNEVSRLGIKKTYLNSRCKKCASLASGEWGRKNREYLYKKWIEKKEYLLKQIRDGYGGKCECCGESNPLFLTIDHVNSDGYKRRPRNKNGNYSSDTFSGHYYDRIIKAGFPKEYRLLCWNCNCGRARNKGVCPHKETWKQ